LQYGERIFNISKGNEEERIEQTIIKTEDFFKSVGMKTRLSEFGIGMETIEKIAKRFNNDGVAYGENRNITGDVARKILLSCQ
jgi:NADP-dependent alcohol dehydrogenase